MTLITTPEKQRQRETRSNLKAHLQGHTSSHKVFTPPNLSQFHSQRWDYGDQSYSTITPVLSSERKTSLKLWLGRGGQWYLKAEAHIPGWLVVSKPWHRSSWSQMNKPSSSLWPSADTRPVSLSLLLEDCFLEIEKLFWACFLCQCCGAKTHFPGVSFSCYARMLCLLFQPLLLSFASLIPRLLHTHLRLRPVHHKMPHFPLPWALSDFTETSTNVATTVSQIYACNPL